MEKKNALLDAVTVIWLDDENARFYKKGDFIAVEVLSEEEKVFVDKGAVTLRRMFPFDERTTMITVLDSKDEEIGIIRDTSLLSSADMLEEELDKIYFMPRITVIHSMKERFGYSVWRVSSDKGELEFTLNDVYKSLIKLGKRIIVNDIDGNRYEIEDVFALDKRSFRKIELYL